MGWLLILTPIAFDRCYIFFREQQLPRVWQLFHSQISIKTSWQMHWVNCLAKETYRYLSTKLFPCQHLCHHLTLWRGKELIRVDENNTRAKHLFNDEPDPFSWTCWPPRCNVLWSDINSQLCLLENQRKLWWKANAYQCIWNSPPCTSGLHHPLTIWNAPA